MEDRWKFILREEIACLKSEIRANPHSKGVYVQHSFVRGYIYGLHTAGIINMKLLLALEKEINNIVFK